MAFLRSSLGSFQKLPTYMAAVTRLAILLDWHKLGSDASIMPKPVDDPGLPFGSCSLRRQFGLVAWNNTLFGAFIMAQAGRNDLALFSVRETDSTACCSRCPAQSRRVRLAVPVQRRASLIRALTCCAVFFLRRRRSLINPHPRSDTLRRTTTSWARRWRSSLNRCT